MHFLFQQYLQSIIFVFKELFSSEAQLLWQLNNAKTLCIINDHFSIQELGGFVTHGNLLQLLKHRY